MNGIDALGFIIAAEASTLAGRSAETRALMDQALLISLADLDRAFSGMPRKAPWAIARAQAGGSIASTPAAIQPYVAEEKVTAQPEPELAAAPEPEPEPEP